MKVVSSALTRFHIFNQAQQLSRFGILDQLITGYPSYAMKKWPDIAEEARLLPLYGALQQLLVRLDRQKKIDVSKLWELLYQGFSREVSKQIHGNMDAIIGLSGFMMEVIPQAKQKNVKTIVDHGSLHERAAKKVFDEECDIYGFELIGNIKHPWMLRRMENEFAEADFVFCCSNLAKQSMEQYGVDGKKIFVNQLGVDLSKFAPNVGNVNKADKVRILMVSNVIVAKGVHYLMKAFVKANLPNTELWVVGNYPQDKRLKEIIKEAMCVNGSIKLFGAMPESKLPEIYRKCDLFVLPSLSDGWAMVVLQAMASGLPVIVSDMTGSKEIVDEGVTGWVIPSRNVDALAKTMCEAVQDRDKLQYMGKRARQSVLKGYAWDNYGQRLFEWTVRNIN